MPIALPDPHQVPRGPHRQFLVEVHRLYRAAGLPSVREMSREIRERDDLPDTVSHETISNLLRGEAVQRWAKVESVVLILARRAREPEDRVLATVKPLWLATQTVVQAGDSAVQRSLDADTSALLASVQTRVEQGGQIGLVVEHETARLSYVMGVYRCTLRRALFNGWDRPITQFPIRIQVDRFPDDPARSLAHHRDHPLTFEELRLVASCAGEPMDWRPTSDRETYKAVSLLFENVQSRFPLYPGQRTTIEYAYRVGADKWGEWFQRAVRLPTKRLVILWQNG